MRSAGLGQMLIVDASALYESLSGGLRADAIRTRLAIDPDHGAPHLIDAEVLGSLRRDHMLGRLDTTAATLAVRRLREWQGTRYPHRALLERVWELRTNVRTWDAFYVALAEMLGATLITLDRRLAAAPGVRCGVETPGYEGG